MSFFQELKRRNVFRVAIAYIIVAWLLLQVADTLAPALRLPEWFQSGVAFVLILGFPIAMIFAWAFELTPEGVKLEKQVDRTESITNQTGQKLNATIITLLVVAVAYLAFDKFMPGEDAADAVTQVASEPSIAVLPFTNMSDDASNEFFADGITEELLNLLAKIPELEVTSRTSAFQFKGKDIDIPTVAKQLNVEHVLEGSVRKAGMTVRITAQLIDADTDKHVWSETYDRELDDIFAIQDEIARKVVDELHVTLLGAAPKAQTTDAEAYTLYLEGLHYMEVQSPDSWRSARERFEAVIDADPSYAPAWYGRARAVRAMANYGTIDLNEGTELARQWTQHATDLDPTLAEPWALLAQISLVYDWDWEAASDYVNRALEVGPNNARALGEASRLYQVLGQLDKMTEYADRALQQNPLGNLALDWVGSTYWYRGDWDRAEEIFLKGEALHGTDFHPGNMTITMLMQGRYEEAAALSDAMGDAYGDVAVNMNVGFTHHYVGRKEEALAARQWMIDNLAGPFGYQIAEMYAVHGDIDKAFEWLESSYDFHDGGMTYLLVDHFLKPLHDDPRWRPLLEKMNLLTYWDAMPTRR